MEFLLMKQNHDLILCALSFFTYTPHCFAQARLQGAIRFADASVFAPRVSIGAPPMPKTEAPMPTPASGSGQNGGTEMAPHVPEETTPRAKAPSFPKPKKTQKFLD